MTRRVRPSVPRPGPAGAGVPRRWWLLLRPVRAVGTVATVCFLVFLALDALPGDAATQRLGASASESAAEELRAAYGLDRGVLVRFASWAAGLLHGDLGQVLATGVPVGDALPVALGRTAVLLVLGVLGIAVLGVGGGVLAGISAGRLRDRALSTGALLAICTPEFVIGTATVLVFATWWGALPAVSLVPAGGTVLQAPEVLVLPALTLTLVGSGVLLRQVRAVVAEQDAGAHVEAARLAGLPERRVILRHLMPGARRPVLQACASLVPYLVGGTVVVERVFAFPGIGSMLVSAVQNREPDVVMACTLLVVTLTVTAYAVADGRTGEVGRG